MANEGIWMGKEVIKSGWKGCFRDNAFGGADFGKEVTVKEICVFFSSSFVFFLLSSQSTQTHVNLNLSAFIHVAAFSAGLSAVAE